MYLKDIFDTKAELHQVFEKLLYLLCCMSNYLYS